MNKINLISIFAIFSVFTAVPLVAYADELVIPAEIEEVKPTLNSTRKTITGTVYDVTQKKVTKKNAKKPPVFECTKVIADVEVRLYKQNTSTKRMDVVDTTKTTSEGRYFFFTEQPGNYVVFFVLPKGEILSELATSKKFTIADSQDETQRSSNQRSYINDICLKEFAYKLAK